MSSEQCPFCKSEVNQGATVCHSCGAYKGKNSETGSFSLWPGMGLTLFGLLAVLAGFNQKADGIDHWASFHDWGIVGFGATILLIGITLTYFTVKKGLETSWLRRN